MPIIDAILKLRPTAQTSAAISEALTRATDADRSEQAELARLEQQRNDLLLDGSATELTKAEAALASAREAAGRVSVVRQQLEQRLTAAIEAEAAAAVEAARVAAETASAKIAEWWMKHRIELEKTLTQGLRLREAAFGSYQEWHHKTVLTAQTHPGLTFEQPKGHADDPGSWHLDLATMARSESFEGLAELPVRYEEGDYSQTKRIPRSSR